LRKYRRRFAKKNLLLIWKIGSGKNKKTKNESKASKPEEVRKKKETKNESKTSKPEEFGKKNETKKESKGIKPDDVFDQTKSDDEDKSDHKIKQTTSSNPKRLNTETEATLESAKRLKPSKPETFETDRESDIPETFSITIPRKEFNRICEVSTKQIPLKPIGKQQPEIHCPVHCNA
jgi:hypothetical protein